MLINRAETEKFLKALEPNEDTFTFQTFDDNPKRKDAKLVKVLHGTLAQHWDALARLNKAGAGIYITVNATDGKGRKATNIVRIRAVFVDLDGAPLQPAIAKPVPHIIVESSPKRWHAYWRVKDMPVDNKVFRAAQRKLIKRLGSDPAVTDLPRVLRLPGFIHQKSKPYRVKIVQLRNGAAFKAQQFLDLEDDKPTKKFTFPRQPVDMKELNAALDVIPSDEYDVWFRVGGALAHELGDEGYEIFDRWSRKSDKYDKRQCQRKWQECLKTHDLSMGTIKFLADQYDSKWRDQFEDQLPEETLAIEEFVAYLPAHNYVYLPTGHHWPASSINSRLPKQTHGNKRLAASVWLDKNRHVEAVTWMPGEPEIIPDKVTRVEGGWIHVQGASCLNKYHPPIVQPRDAKQAQPWIALVRNIFPSDADHIINFLAQRVQFPAVKINHALMLGGDQGIGKDTILEPVKHAVGPWNFAEISPGDVMARFNSHVRSVICRISEAHDLGNELDRFKFYEHLKTLTASPPDMLGCEEKYLAKYAVANVTGVIITTNYKTGGIYLPPHDRRTYVAWSRKQREEFSDDYWKDLWRWYHSGGIEHIVAYLHAHDLSRFDPKEAPPQTAAFLDIVESNLPTEDGEFAEALDVLGQPDAVTIGMIFKATSSHSFANWLAERKNARLIPFRLESCGYTPVRNPTAAGHNRWAYRVSQGDGKSTQHRVAVYAKADLSEPKRLSAAQQLIRQYQTLGEHLGAQH